MLYKNDIPFPTIPINLKADIPSKVTPEELQKELHSIGLTCKETNIDKLQQYISDTVKEFPCGKVQGYGVMNYKIPEISEFVENGCTFKSMSEIVCNDDTIHTNWQPVDICPYSNQLACVGYPPHFDYLKENFLGFAGVKSDQTYTKNDSTVAAIKEQFVKIAVNMSSTLIDDLDTDLLEAVLTKVIAPVDPSASDYDSKLQSRNIYLVKGYNPSTNPPSCECIGIINVEYRLQIKNYKEKKSSHNEYTLNVTVRTAWYNDINELENEVQFIQTHFKGKMFFGYLNDIPFQTETTIFDALPPACEDTFIKSLPLMQTENDIISVMVCYTPDLDNIGCIDNTNSESSAQYSKTITSGFSFTFGQKIGASTKFSAGVLVAKAEINFSLEISFTEQWNNSQSETISFTVPKNSKAYLYQGYLNCAVLEYNLKTLTYKYTDSGRFLTNMLTTSRNPIQNIRPQIVSKSKNEAAIELNGGKLPLWLTINNGSEK